MIHTQKGEQQMSTKPYGEMICPLCGKPFVCHYTSTWKYRKYYKRKLYIMCSWKCLQALEKTAEEEKLKKQQEKEKKRKYGCNAPD